MATPTPWEIPFKSDLHRKVKREILERFQMSQERMSARYSQWSQNEELFRAYLPHDKNERSLMEARRQRGQQDYVTIEIPYSYAIALSAHTYISSVFLGRSPIMQYQGLHGESQLQETAVESLINYQVQTGRMMQPLYVWLLDPEKYGIGILGVYWDEEIGITTQVNGEGRSRQLLPLRQTLYQGNRVFNVRPHDWYPDPRVPLVRFQDGEFCGVRREIGWNDIKKKMLNGEFFNQEEAEKCFKGGPPMDSRLNVRGQPTVDATLNSWSSSKISTKAFGEIIEMTIELSAKDWGIKSPGQPAEDYPEKWTFTILNREIIIGARPQGFYHQRFPFCVLEGEIDGYSFAARATPEILAPLNYTLSWLFNSHFNNVRAMQDGTWIVDPLRVNMSSFGAQTAGGRIITLRPQAYGTDVSKAITQITPFDSTQRNLQDAQILVELMQRVSGVTDNVMGAPHPGGRKTATEVRTSSSFSINRLATKAEYHSATGFSPLAQMLLQNTQQLYDDTKLFRILRGVPDKENPFINVDPAAIAGSFDFTPIDGTLPIDRYQQAHMLMEFFQTIMGSPAGQEYDLSEGFNLFGNLIQVPGLNALRVQIAPDAEVMQRAATGQSTPLSSPSSPAAGPLAPGPSSPLINSPG